MMFNDETQANERMAARKGFEAAVRGFRHVGLLRERDGKVIACSQIIKPIEESGKAYFSADTPPNSVASNRAWSDFSAPFVHHYPLREFAELVQSVKESEAAYEAAKSVNEDEAARHAAKSDSLISTVSDVFMEDALGSGPVDQEPVLLDSGHVTTLTFLRRLKSKHYLAPLTNPWTRDKLERYAVDPFSFALGSWMRNPDATPFAGLSQGEYPFVVWEDIKSIDKSKHFNSTQSKLTNGLIAAYLTYVCCSLIFSGLETVRSMAEADSVSSSLRRGGASVEGALQRLLLAGILYVSAQFALKFCRSISQGMMGPQTPPSFKELASGSMIASSAFHAAGDEVAQPRATRNEGASGSMIASSAFHAAGDEVAQPRATRNEGGRGRQGGAVRHQR